MAPSSSRPMQKLGGAMILVVAVLCVSVSLPTVSASGKPHPSKPDYRPPKYPPTYEHQPYYVNLCNPYYYRLSPNHPGYFLQRDAGGYFKQRPCPYGTVFNPYICVCVHSKGKGPYPPYKPYAKPTPPPTPKPPKYYPYHSDTSYDDHHDYDDIYHPDPYSGEGGYGYKT